MEVSAVGHERAWGHGVKVLGGASIWSVCARLVLNDLMLVDHGS